MHFSGKESSVYWKRISTLLVFGYLLIGVCSIYFLNRINTLDKQVAEIKKSGIIFSSMLPEKNLIASKNNTLKPSATNIIPSGSSYNLITALHRKSNKGKTSKTSGDITNRDITYYISRGILSYSFKFRQFHFIR